MDNQNLSDIIEAYLKEVLNQKEQVDIRRNEIAEQFKCVPSQINYVINTRFTIQHGYIVESKRGGGGYIRIIKVKLLDNVDTMETLNELVGQSISERDSFSIINTLFKDGIVTKKEAKLMLAAMEKNKINLESSLEKAIRAEILKRMLLGLKYD